MNELQDSEMIYEEDGDDDEDVNVEDQEVSKEKGVAAVEKEEDASGDGNKDEAALGPVDVDNSDQPASYSKVTSVEPKKLGTVLTPLQGSSHSSKKLPSSNIKSPLTPSQPSSSIAAAPAKTKAGSASSSAVAQEEEKGGDGKKAAESTPSAPSKDSNTSVTTRTRAQSKGQ